MGDEQPPVALRGRRSVASAVDRIDEFLLPETAAMWKPQAPASSDDLASFVKRSLLDAYATAKRLKDIAQKADSGASKLRGSSWVGCEPKTSCGRGVL